MKANSTKLYYFIAFFFVQVSDMHIRINYTKIEITAKYFCKLLRFHSEYICWTLWSSLFYYNFFHFFFIEKKKEKLKVYYVSLRINKNTPIVAWSDEVIYSQRSEFNVWMPERELNNNNPFESYEWNVRFFFSVSLLNFFVCP